MEVEVEVETETDTGMETVRADDCKRHDHTGEKGGGLLKIIHINIIVIIISC